MKKPLTIGVDVRDLQAAKTGTKTYLEELCNEFKKLNSDELHFHFLDSSIPVCKSQYKLFKLIEHLRYLFWKQLLLPLKAYYHYCDVVFCTDNVVPLIHLEFKTIPVFHDAFFFETPEHYGKLWLWLYKLTAIPAAKRASFIITPTAYTKKQINNYLHITNDKLVVVHEAPKSFKDNVYSNMEQALTEQLIPLRGTYILHVGSMFKRKNLPLLINAFSTVKNSGYPQLKLVLAGSFPLNDLESDRDNIMKAIVINNLHNEVILTGYMPDAALKELYKNAVLYVFPSVNEGFGLPVLEAFDHDLPVLVANNSCLPEVGGNAVLQFDPYDEKDLSQKIILVLDDPALRHEMIRKGRERLVQFSWNTTALQLIAVFKKAVNRS